MNCCGKDRDTNYCSECGKKLDINTLEGLLYHCETMAKTWKYAEQWEIWAQLLRKHINAINP